MLDLLVRYIWRQKLAKIGLAIFDSITLLLMDSTTCKIVLSRVL